MNFNLIFFYYFTLFLEVYTESIQLVHVFFRHGSRTPEIDATFPSDPYKADAFLPMGWGQLTNAGKQSSYKLGQLLRARYNSFLGDIYTPEMVIANSTDIDRTKVTALLVLAGLFPPSQSQKWNDAMSWMPIPYHFAKDPYDYTLKRPLTYCPAYSNELENVLASPEAQLTWKANKKLFQYIAKNSRKSINKLLDVFRIYQTLTAERAMNLTLPEWTRSVYPEQMRQVAIKQCEYENYNSVLKRLNGGRMLGLVIKNMVEKANNSLSPAGRKIYLYSGHENNVINILAALNLYAPHVPNYNAAVIIELVYLEETGTHVVRVSYLSDLNEEPKAQQLEGCDVLCPLNEFIEITKSHVPVNYTAECESQISLD